MAESSFIPARSFALASVLTPALVLFISANLANAGNFAFNLLFSRLLTPAQFAELTFLLTLKLGLMSLFGAIQMATSGQVAAGRLTSAHLQNGLLRRVWVLGTLALLPLVLVLALNTPGLNAALVLALALPVVGPLSLLRGLYLGQLNMPRSVASVQLEMMVRLGFSLLFWALGFGLPGLALALTLSIFAAWLPLTGSEKLPECRAGDARALANKAPADRAINSGAAIATQIALAALPLAGLQVAQVLLLDGDIFIARARLSQDDAGVLAALNLIQRIQFFACFGLSMALFPAVLTAVREGRALRRVLWPIAALYLAVTLPLLLFAGLMPGQLLDLVVGQAYSAGTPFVFFSCLAAALFTLTYLAMTLLIALKKVRLVAALLVFTIFQLTLQYLRVSGGDGLAEGDGGLGALVYAKVGCQLFLAGLCLALAWKGLTQRGIKD